jgi:hypothetical protein
MVVHAGKAVEAQQPLLSSTGVTTASPQHRAPPEPLPCSLYVLLPLQRDLEVINDALRIPGNKSLGPVARVSSLLRDAAAARAISNQLPLSRC